MPTKYLSNWKATSYRQFILYAGPVLLKGKISEIKYAHFLKLHCAVRILRDRKLVKEERSLDEAQKYLEDFVKDYNLHFGINKIVYCVHSLIHIVDDVRRISNYPSRICRATISRTSSEIFWVA